MSRAAEALTLTREGALSLANSIGQEALADILDSAQRDLELRLARIGSSKDTLTLQQMKVTLEQIRDVSRFVARGIAQTAVSVGAEAASDAAGGILDYMNKAQRGYGLKHQPLALKEAAMLKAAKEGTRGSILRRLALTPQQLELPAEETEVDESDIDGGRPGSVLDRYSMQTIGDFESILRTGLVTRKPWGDIRDEIRNASPFLQGAPASWAERIVRTEVMGAYNRANWEVIRAADEQLGDMVKILSAVFDSRTGWDSYQVHGQIRMPDEAFEWAGGYYQHPPNRPNDREVVIPHRLSWPIPPELRWRSDGEVAAAWARDRRRGAPPSRPLMTTVPLDKFGRD